MYDYIIIGGAQSGLAMAYYLKKMNANYLIVDGGGEIGESWLNRWNSLKLFTTTEYNHLPGLPFDAPKGHYPDKYEVAAYFKKYVDRFQIPIQFNTLIHELKKTKDGFELSSDKETLTAKNIIVATGPFHTPYTPACSKHMDESINQIHSNFYKSTSQLQEGDTLVVGAGDSGFQILDEVSCDQNRKVYFSGQTRVKAIPQEFLGKTIWWWFTFTGFLKFNKYSWIGKKIKSWSQPVIGTDVKEILNRKNVHPVGRTNDANGTEIDFEKGKVNSIKNVIWATGYRPNFNWIDGIELDKEHYPVNHRGVSNIKGLYFIGLPWMHTRGSATLGGVSKDAEYLFDFMRDSF